MGQSDPQGFTLVELLTAVAIGALIMAVLMSTLQAIATTDKSVSSAGIEDRIARIFIDRVTRELVSVPRDRDSGAVRGLDHEMTDEITIFTLAYGNPMTIHYSWKPAPPIIIPPISPQSIGRARGDQRWQGNSGNVLERDEINPLRINPAPAIVLRQVTGLGLRYYDGQTWKTEWSSADPPKGVSIELHIGNKTYGSIVAL